MRKIITLLLLTDARKAISLMKVRECGWILPLKLNLKNKNYSILDPTMAGTIE